jgi:hypothetical protein
MPPKRDSRETRTKSKGREKRRLLGRTDPLFHSKKSRRKGEAMGKKRKESLKYAKIKKPARETSPQA